MCLFLCSVVAYGATLTGVVRVEQQPIPGATVVAVQGDRKLTATTDEMGSYTLALPAGGEWSVTVEMFGFKPEKRTISDPAAPQEWALTFAPAPPAPAKATNTFQTARFTQLADGLSDLERQTAPAPTEPPGENRDSGIIDTSFVVNGSVSQGLSEPREQDTSFLLRMANEVPPGTAPAEAGGGSFAAATSGVSAGGGGGRRAAAGGGGAAPGKGAKRAAAAKGPFGAGGPSERFKAYLDKLPKDEQAKVLKRLAQRRGTERSFGNKNKKGQPGIRGQFSYTAGNSFFDARSYAITGQYFDKPDYAQNRYNLTLGGPLAITRIPALARTQFTFAWSAGRNRGPYSGFGIVPTALQRAGDFSETQIRGPVTVHDPTTGAPFAGNRIPESRVNPAATGLLKFLPLPNRTSTVQNYQFVASTSRNSDELNFRINQSLSQKNRISGGYTRQSRNSNNPQLLGYIDDISGSGYTVDAGWTFIIGPKRVNDLRFRINRDRNETLPYFANRENTSAALGISGPAVNNPLTWGPPNINFTNFADITDAAPLLRHNQTVSITDSVSISRGNHTIGAGLEFRWARIDTNTDQNARGSLNFSGLLTSGLNSAGQPLPGTGFDFADFLLGFPQSSSIRYGTTSTFFRSNIYATWFQDEWRLRNNLTLNLGLRYEYYTPFYERDGHLANLDIAPAFTAVAVVTPAQPGPYSGQFPRGLVDPDKNNLGPRFGFAWRPIPKSHLQIRGGYSIFFDGAAYNNIASRLAGQPPFASTSSLSTSLSRRLTLQNGFGNFGELGKTVTNNFAVARNYLLPYAQTWNFSVQQELVGHVIELACTGTKGTRLDVLRQPNRAAPGSPLTAEQRRLIGNAVGFTFDSSEANSIFHSGTLRVTRRLRKGLSYNASYTWAKSIDNASNIGGGGGTVAQDDGNLAAERGLSSFDLRHQFQLTHLISSPFGENAFFLKDRSIAAKLLKDWNLSTTFVARTGRPFTARVLGNISDAGGTGSTGSGRADSTGQPVTGTSGFFNAQAFMTPPSGRFGNAGRNTIPGPGFTGINVSFGRSFNLGEKHRFEIRANSENALNQVNYTSLGTVINALNYGSPTNVSSMRQVTLTARFRF
ncbi:MAG: TonB-dependent receptor [Bryobacteraceae bacterium]|nr:TonB-dependent receptor [Bryobacteraceae bacterium]